jgi:hypothetical protein
LEENLEFKELNYMFNSYEMELYSVEGTCHREEKIFGSSGADGA